MSTGLFNHNRNPAASYANKQRKPKARQEYRKQRLVQAKRRIPAVGRKPAKRDQVAEMLSEDFSIDQIAEGVSITPKAVRRHLEAIRKRLGPQAI